MECQSHAPQLYLFLFLDLVTVQLGRGLRADVLVMSSIPATERCNLTIMDYSMFKWSPKTGKDKRKEKAYLIMNTIPLDQTSICPGSDAG